MKQANIVCFSEVFHFAEKEYDIGWNPANDVFFGNAFEYRQMSSVPLADEVVQYLDFENMAAYLDVDEDALTKKFENADDIFKVLSKEEVNELPDLDKSYLITAHYLQTINAKGNVLIDSQ